MADENNQFEPSLDDIFSRIRKEDKDKKKEILIPFKFLDPYTSDDKNIFFGRDNETEDIFRKLYSGKIFSENYIQEAYACLWKIRNREIINY